MLAGAHTTHGESYSTNRIARCELRTSIGTVLGLEIQLRRTVRRAGRSARAVRGTGLVRLAASFRLPNAVTSDRSAPAIWKPPLQFGYDISMARWPRHVWTTIFTYGSDLRGVSVAVLVGVCLGPRLVRSVRHETRTAQLAVDAWAGTFTRVLGRANRRTAAIRWPNRFAASILRSSSGCSASSRAVKTGRPRLSVRHRRLPRGSNSPDNPFSQDEASGSRPQDLRSGRSRRRDCRRRARNAAGVRSSQGHVSHRAGLRLVAVPHSVREGAGDGRRYGVRVPLLVMTSPRDARRNRRISENRITVSVCRPKTCDSFARADARRRSGDGESAAWPTRTSWH